MQCADVHDVAAHARDVARAAPQVGVDDVGSPCGDQFSEASLGAPERRYLEHRDAGLERVDDTHAGRVAVVAAHHERHLVAARQRGARLGRRPLGAGKAAREDHLHDAQATSSVDGVWLRGR